MLPRLAVESSASAKLVWSVPQRVGWPVGGRALALATSRRFATRTGNRPDMQVTGKRQPAVQPFSVEAIRLVGRLPFGGEAVGCPRQPASALCGEGWLP